MPNGNAIPLSHMRPGQSGMVAEIRGGYGMVNRLNGMGIMPRKRIKKVSSMIGRGPITIEVDRAQIAIGFRMAQRIIVALD
ncbi:MAG: FeoA family protein [Thermodesulfobacteriota bacterium]